MLKQALGICAIIVLGACASDRVGDAPTNGSLERHVVTMPGGTIGTILAAVRCGSTIYLADTDSRIHRVSLNGETLAPMEIDGLMPMALAADCRRGHLWVVSTLPRGQSMRGMRAVALALASGERVREWPISTACLPGSADVAGDELFIGGECRPLPAGGADGAPTAGAYYADKQMGVRVTLSTGAVRPGVKPYETECIGAGACVGGAVAAFGNNWLAVLPASARVAEYRGDGELVRTFDVVSPSFMSDGSKLPLSAGSEERVQWSARNSLLHRAFVVGDRIAVAHYLTVVPPGWTMASAARPQFKTNLTTYSRDGVVDKQLSLSDLPVGADHESVFVVDYGPAGRQGAHDSVTLERVVLR